jgi:hypothetical protein
MSGVHGERGQAERQEQSYLTEEARLAHAAALREWASIALARELPRLGNTPDNEKGLAWIHYRSIKDGEWFVAAKPELEAGMRPGIELKERIWHCGVLAATGFKGELAVKLSGGVLRPLSANDIRKRLNRADDEWAAEIGLDLADEQREKLHVSKQKVRLRLAELEDEGRALRTLRDGTPLRNLPAERRKGLHEGDVLLFFFLRPLPPDPKVVALIRLPKSVNPSPIREISRFLKLLNLDLDPEVVATSDYLQSELTVAVSNYQEAVVVAKERAQEGVRVAAQCEHIEKNDSAKNDSVIPPPPPPCHASEAPADDEEEPLLAVPPAELPPPPPATPYGTFKLLYPKNRFDEPKTRTAFQGLNETEQQHVLERLGVYLQCPRWVALPAEGEARYIPFSSNWLKTYDADPPPRFTGERAVETRRGEDQRLRGPSACVSPTSSHRRYVMSLCSLCNGSGWLVVERADGTSAAKQCECHGKPTRTVPNAKPITEEVAVAVTAALCEILEFAPTTVMGQMVISDALMSMCNTEEEAFWLLRRVSELYKKWGS